VPVESDELRTKLANLLDKVTYQLGLGPFADVRCAERIYVPTLRLAARDCPSQTPRRFDTKVESQIQHSEKPADSVNPENALSLGRQVDGSTTPIITDFSNNHILCRPIGFPADRKQCNLTTDAI
jgi:hypothetical protein